MSASTRDEDSRDGCRREMDIILTHEVHDPSFVVEIHGDIPIF